MAHANISIFIPHVGCPHMCSFCNQRTISGAESIPHGEGVKAICREALGQVKDPQDTEIAFFGGSFTAVSRDYMEELLSAAADFVGEDKFKGIRISTRPDHIDKEILDILRSYGVTSIELGAQSMCDHVLKANDRGHTSEDVEKASQLISSCGFELGLQMMIGLYQSTPADEYNTFEKIIQLAPDTLRIYPVVIIEGTRLGELFKSGEYIPFEFDSVVDMCSEFMERAQQDNVRVIKVGLHASEFVERDMLGGFYHPAFRELCEGRIYRRRLDEVLSGGYTYGEFSVPQKNLSKAMGHKKCNIEYYNKLGITLKMIPDNDQTEFLRIIKIK